MKMTRHTGGNGKLGSGSFGLFLMISFLLGFAVIIMIRNPNQAPARIQIGYPDQSIQYLFSGKATVRRIEPLPAYAGSTNEVLVKAVELDVVGQRGVGIAVSIVPASMVLETNEVVKVLCAIFHENGIMRRMIIIDK